VPADDAGALGEALSHLREARAESLQPGELDALDEALDQLEAGSGPLEVTAPRPLLSEAAKVAIDEASDRLSLQATAMLRGEASPAEVTSELEAVRRLLELLNEVGG
jgi:hypothetical protein